MRGISMKSRESLDKVWVVHCRFSFNNQFTKAFLSKEDADEFIQAVTTNEDTADARVSIKAVDIGPSTTVHSKRKYFTAGVDKGIRTRYVLKNKKWTAGHKAKFDGVIMEARGATEEEAINNAKEAMKTYLYLGYATKDVKECKNG